MEARVRIHNNGISKSHPYREILEPTVGLVGVMLLVGPTP